MMYSVLRSPRAVQVNVEIMRAFVRLRRMLQSHAELARKLEALERKYDRQFKVVFDAIREIMTPDPPPKRRQIGFHSAAMNAASSRRSISEMGFTVVSPCAGGACGRPAGAPVRPRDRSPEPFPVGI